MRIEEATAAQRFFADAERLKSAAFVALLFTAATITFSVSLFEISAGLFTVLALLSMAASRRAPLKGGALAWALAAYMLAVLASVTQSEHLYASWRGVFKVLRNLLLFVSVVHVVDTPERFARLFRFMLVVAAVIGIDGLLQSVLKQDLLRGRQMTPFLGETKRLTGPYRHANDFSAYLTFASFLFLGTTLEARRLFGHRAWLHGAGLAVVLACLFGTYSRGAWLAVAMVFAVLACVKKSRLFLGCIAGVALWTAFFSPPEVRSRFETLASGKGTVQERTILWGESVRMIRSSPWLGLGANTYAKNQPRFREEGSKHDNQYAHNGYLQIAAEIGLLGLAAFLASMAILLVSTLRAFLATHDDFLKSAGTALSLGLLAFLLHSFTDTNLQSVLLVNTLWLGAGLAWAGASLAAAGRR